MLEFILVGLFGSLVLGSFFALIITENMNHAKEPTKIIAGILIALIIGFSFSGGVAIEEKTSEKAWNDGKCYVCGEPWEFKNSYKSRRSITYYYSCNNCNEVIFEKHYY